MKALELIDELSKQATANGSDDFRTFNAINAGRYKMSVQGSMGHYCSPRQTLHPDAYSDMELALFSSKGWLHVSKSKKVRAFPRYNELIERADGPISQSVVVFGYVPVDLLNDLYLYLKEK